MATLAAWLCGSSDKPDRFARPDYTVAFGRDYDSDGEVPLEAVAACWGSSDMVAASWGQMCAANLDLERETRRCLPKLLATWSLPHRVGAMLEDGRAAHGK